ncbi:IS6 family transposase [Formosimonas limnophila]|uniref:IS6 family transposase n=2 Tax=Formosimonas limnophila TaxID=1384487 RepID=A0A8J3G113_9BURK|nr:IS6 family transposase [Formosimonas limnophila]
MAERGLDLTYETVRYWCLKFGSQYAKRIKKHQQCGDRWHLDEVYCRIGGEMMYLWRAVDQDGQTLDILVQRKRNAQAALKFLKKLRKQGAYPRSIVTDKLKSYIKPSKCVFSGARHIRDKGANNRAENSHQATRLREAKMRCFKSLGQAQRFLSNFGSIYDFFRFDAHKTSAKTHRILRARSFEFWRNLTQNPSIG